MQFTIDRSRPPLVIFRVDVPSSPAVILDESAPVGERLMVAVEAGIIAETEAAVTAYLESL